MLASGSVIEDRQYALHVCLSVAYTTVCRGRRPIIWQIKVLVPNKHPQGPGYETQGDEQKFLEGALRSTIVEPTRRFAPCAFATASTQAGMVIVVDETLRSQTALSPLLPRFVVDLPPFRCGCSFASQTNNLGSCWSHR